MTFKGIMSAAAAAGLAFAPVAAQAGDADRSAAPVAGENAMGGDGRAVAAIFAILVFVAALVAAAGEDDEPVSA